MNISINYRLWDQVNLLRLYLLTNGYFPILKLDLFFLWVFAGESAKTFFFQIPSSFVVIEKAIIEEGKMSELNFFLFEDFYPFKPFYESMNVFWFAAPVQNYSKLMCLVYFFRYFDDDVVQNRGVDVIHFVASG